MTMKGKHSIYFATVAMHPGMMKIGCTTKSVDVRMAEMSRIIMSDFKAVKRFEFPENVNIKRVEALLHSSFAAHRVRPDREFFHIVCMEDATDLAWKLIEHYEGELPKFLDEKHARELRTILIKLKVLLEEIKKEEKRAGYRDPEITKQLMEFSSVLEGYLNSTPKTINA